MVVHSFHNWCKLNVQPFPYLLHHIFATPLQCTPGSEAMFFNYKLHPLGPLFLTWINFTPSMNSYLMKQFAHNWYLPCCQCTETCSQVSFIQNNIYMPEPGVSSPVENRSCPESTRCCSQCVKPLSWCQSVLRRLGHGRVVKTLAK